MAIMIPDRMPSGASAGEKRLFSVLQKLPDDCIAYYEPLVRNRYPDFVVILPKAGVLVIEVKGWYPNEIKSFDYKIVDVLHRNQLRKEVHPLEQSRKYKFRLMDEVKTHPLASTMLHDDGPHQGRMKYPFMHIVVMSNMTRDHIDSLTAENAPSFLPSITSVSRDELIALEEAAPEEILHKLSETNKELWSPHPMSDEDINAIRSIIHPEIILDRLGGDTAGAKDIKVLDLTQERRARKIGQGHRIVRGVAGSGKTVLLIARAKLLAEDPKKRILVLCYNRALAEYFHSVFVGYPNIDAMTFHGWGSAQEVFFNRNESEEDFGGRLLHRIISGQGDGNKYDAVCIDEAQDFDRSWFMCAKQALQEPDDGDLLIVMDGNQNVYRRKGFTWTSAGINAIGRVLPSAQYDLSRNYRNTIEILEVAAGFTRTTVLEDDVAHQAQAVTPESAYRHGPRPQFQDHANRRAEAVTIAGVVRKLLNFGTNQAGDRIRPRDIAILYRMLPQADVPNMIELRDRVADAAPVVIPTKPALSVVDVGSAEADKCIQIRTIHSVKGLQFPVVIMCWIDQMPFRTDPETKTSEASLFYVGMTRAEQNLILTSAGKSSFTEELSKMGLPSTGV